MFVARCMENNKRNFRFADLKTAFNLDKKINKTLITIMVKELVDRG